MKNNLFDKIRCNISYFLCLCFMAGILTSCADELFLKSTDDIPDGESEFVVTVDYKAFNGVSLESSTRAAANGENFDGKALKKIESLWVVIYEPSGDDWVLTSDSPIRITAATHSLTTEEVGNQRPDNLPQAEETTWKAEFKMRLKNGTYRMYAVANFDLGKIDRDAMASPAGLKSIPLTWNPEKLSDNSEMFGILSESDGNVIEDENVRIKPGSRLHAWVRRAASKVTVGFDTSNLFDGIDIYLKSVSLRDIPKECYLGRDNKPDPNDKEQDRNISNDLISVGPTLYFGQAKDNADYSKHMLWTRISRQTGYWGYRSEMGHTGAPSVSDIDNRKVWEHAEVTDALYLYENKQGVSWKDTSQSVASPNNEWGWTDDIGYPNPIDGDPGSGWKDCMAYGSYIEVEAYYVCRVKGREQEGPIKYRFMLGRDAAKDYNTDRNSHFKLTLKFNGMANDADWHVDYKAPVLTVSEPRVFDYRGMVFCQDTSIPNWGQDFRPENVVTVNSYEGYSDNQDYLDIKIEYKEDGDSDWKDECSWLNHTISPGESAVEKKVNFKADTTYTCVKIADRIGVNEEKGKTTRYNLSHPSGTANDIQETANTYIVDAQGKYILPLIYGNGYMKGSRNEKAYKYQGSESGELYLQTFKNHRNANITSPVIKENANCTPANAVLVWQDEPSLVQNIGLDMTAFEGIGGLVFDVLPNEGKMREGNAVLAVRDASNNVIWSWQIWVTCLDFNVKDGYDFGETIPVTGYRYAGIYQTLPMNLGWCSGGEEIRAYPSRKCDVRISNGRRSEVITIHQASHLAFPHGNNPYYQWGRKDPFIAGIGDNTNKTRYTPSQTLTDNPQRLYDDQFRDGYYKGATRKSTRDALDLLIKHPDIWHNPPRTITNGSPISNNVTYDNLWSNHPMERYKTIYDPCPPGYVVPNRFAFSGFTDTGGNINYTDENYHNFVWDVRLNQVGDGCPTEGVYEFYTDSRKIQSICFPMTGYRDWDDQSKLYWWTRRGIVWANERPSLGNCHAYYFLYSREFKEVLPSDHFVSTDGCCVRPVKIK